MELKADGNLAMRVGEALPTLFVSDIVCDKKRYDFFLKDECETCIMIYDKPSSLDWKALKITIRHINSSII